MVPITLPNVRTCRAVVELALPAALLKRTVIWTGCGGHDRQSQNLLLFQHEYP